MAINKQLLVERLTQRIDLDRIFLFSYSFLGKEHQHLILVMKPEDGISPKVMMPIVELCLLDIPDISFELILFGTWKNKVRHGSLYYAYASLPQHQVYTSSRKKSKVLSASELGGIVELAEQLRVKMVRTSEEFREGAAKFAETGDFLKATFMVHQSLEAILRLQQSMVEGKMNNVHGLENRMRALSSHFPAFRRVLLSETFIEMETFRLLDQSFHVVKQHKELELSAVDASYLYDKCREISNAVEMLYQFFLDSLKAEQQARLEQAARQVQLEEERKKEASVRASVEMEQGGNELHCEDFAGFPFLPEYKEDIHKLLDKIRSTHRPEQIMMLNYRTGGFSGSNIFQPDSSDTPGIKVELYLVVIMKNTGPFHFKCMQVGVASAMILYLDLGYVERKLAEGGRFVHTLWTKGHVLRRKSTFKPDFKIEEVDWKGEWERADAIWKRGRTVIDNLVNTAKNADSLSVDTGILILRNIMEIGVNSFLNVSIGFIPKAKNLVELTDWSGVVDGHLLEYLLDKNKLKSQMLHLILHPKCVWWEDVLLDSYEKVVPDFYGIQAEKLGNMFDGICSRAIEGIKSKITMDTPATNLVVSPSMGDI